jgi:serine/threonine protein kinase
MHIWPRITYRCLRGRFSRGCHPAIRIACTRGYPGKWLAYKCRYLESGMPGTSSNIQHFSFVVLIDDLFFFLVIWVSNREMALFPQKRAHLERWVIPPCAYACVGRGRFWSTLHPGGGALWTIFYAGSWDLLFSPWFVFILGIEFSYIYRWSQDYGSEHSQFGTNFGCLWCFGWFWEAVFVEKWYYVFIDIRIFFIDFLHSMLRLKPSDRASAEELLEHEWVKWGWVCQNLQCSKKCVYLLSISRLLVLLLNLTVCFSSRLALLPATKNLQSSVTANHSERIKKLRCW